MLAKTKIGPQLNITGNQDATKWLLRGQPSMAVGIHSGPPGEIANQPIHWVYRVYEDDLQPSNPSAGGYSILPNIAAQQWVDRHLHAFIRANSVRYITILNEPVVHEPEVMTWLALFLATAVRIVRQVYGVTPVVGNWSVGSPDYSLWVQYVPVLQAVTQYGGILGRHSYGPIDPHYALRHRTDNAIFGDLGFPNLPVMLTEAGWENLPEVGFRAWATDPQRTNEEYVQYLLTLDHELRQDAYCLGASIFTYGLSWSQHNLNDSGVGDLFGAKVEGRTPFDVSVPVVRPSLTNQQVLNAVGAEGKERGINLIGKMPHDLLQRMVSARALPYSGPNPRDWGLSDNERADIAERLGI